MEVLFSVSLDLRKFNLLRMLICTPELVMNKFIFITVVKAEYVGNDLRRQLNLNVARCLYDRWR